MNAVTVEGLLDLNCLHPYRFETLYKISELIMNVKLMNERLSLIKMVSVNGTRNRVPCCIYLKLNGLLDTWIPLAAERSASNPLHFAALFLD